jgi:hypothetical protein
MIRSRQYENLLTEVGARLEGGNEKALLRDHALVAVQMLRDAKVPILGGDVWAKRNEKFVSVGDNWFFDPTALEERTAYFIRTWEGTETYIRAYPASPAEEVRFVLVTGDPAGIWRAGPSHA